MKNLFKLLICLVLTFITVLTVVNSNVNELASVEADSELVAITTDDGSTIKYRNTSTNIMRLSEYNYPTQNLRACWVSHFIGSVPNYTTETKWKSDFNHVLDVMESYGLNCVIFHVRTHNNALYKSELNPVATFFSKVDFDSFDPLEWAIEATHERGMEFHAWMNPYRISTNGTTTQYVSGSIPSVNPVNDSDNLLQSGNSIILNPGIQSNRDFIVDSCMEVVENYDVDAIHFDDYFYIDGVETDKNADWKREQVDLFIEDLSNNLRTYNKNNNKTVQLGIAPSGIYRNGSYSSSATYDSNGNLKSPLYSNTSGFAHYDNYLYSDTLKWINEEWIDYIMPQTYWALSHPTASFGELSKWWSWAVKNKDVNLYLSSGFYMAADGNSYWNKNINEIRDQLLNAEMYDEVGGFAFYRYNDLQGTNTVIETGMNLLKTDYFKTKIPCDVKKYYAPLYDTVEVENVKIENNTITYDACENVRGYVVYKVANNTEVDQEDINQVYYYGTDLSVELDDTSNYSYYVSSVNLANEISEPVTEVTEKPVEPEQPEIDTTLPSINIYKKNVSYSSETYMMFAVNNTNFDANENNIKMLFWNSLQDSYTKGTESYEVTTSGTTTINGTTCYIYKSNGLAPKELTDNIYARAYAEVDGEIIYSDVIKYSVLEYYYEMKEAGTMGTNLANLLDGLMNYGALAQLNFNYNTSRLANATYYKVNVVNGVLQDGFTSGRYQTTETITLTPNEAPLGMKFAYWKDSNNNVISTSKTVTLGVTKAVSYEAVYEEDLGVTVLDEITIDVEQYKDIDTTLVPTTVTLSSGLITEEVEVSWDLSTYDKTKVGTQTVYGELVNSDYELEEPLTMEINVIAYTLEYDSINNEYAIIEYFGTTANETVPSTFNGIPITSIEQSAFYECTYLTSLVIPEGIESIGAYAFQYCSNLVSIELPSTLTSTGTYAYSMCSSLQNVYYNGTIENWCGISYDNLFANPMYYAQSNFYQKDNTGTWQTVTEIVIPDTVTVIKDYSFAYFRNVTSIELPSYVTTIGTESFRACRNVTSIALPSTLKSIGANAFYLCNSLKTVYNVSSLYLTTGSSNYGYIAYYASNIYSYLPE